MTGQRRVLAWIFAAVIVVGVVVYLAAADAATNQAQRNYKNSIAGCHRANAHYLADNLVIEAAAASSTNPEVREGAREALRHIREQPHVRRNGTTECAKAVIAP
jgi:hypothetical protein